MPKLPTVAIALLASATLVAARQSDRTPDALLDRQLDVVVPRTLEMTKTPSVSVAVVRDGALVLARAWGRARLEPSRPATPDMRYLIGSVTKQFTAAALLLLQEDGRLSLDDRVARHLPDVAHADQITIRQLLSHTAGYDDYWPQDYAPQYIFKTADVPQIIHDWAGRPLTFTPGAAWEYSNTNYVIAGAIVEKVSGVPFFQFLRTRIFEPLKMRSVFDYARNVLPSTDAAAYTAFALGPIRPATREANAWLFAAGNLAMTTKDLASWDLSMISKTLLKEASYREQQTEARRTDAVRTNYGLGISLTPSMGRRTVSHLGGGSGFSSANYVFPDDRAAVIVLSNGDSPRAVWSIAEFINRSLFSPKPLPAQPEEEARVRPPIAAGLGGSRPEPMKARRIFEGLQKGQLDRALFTDNANAFFTKQALADFAAGLAPLGPATYLWQTSESKRAGMIARVFQAWFPDRTIHITTLETRDARLEQFAIDLAPPQWR